MLKAVKNLIAFGVDKGYIAKDYQLIGHRQVRDTECPGEKLYKEIQTWEHYVPAPHYNQDRNDIPESVLLNSTNILQNSISSNKTSSNTTTTRTTNVNST